MAAPTTVVDLAMSINVSQMVGAAMLVLAALLSLFLVLYSVGLVVERFYPSLLQERRVHVETRYHHRTGKKYYVQKGLFR